MKTFTDNCNATPAFAVYSAVVSGLQGDSQAALQLTHMAMTDLQVSAPPPPTKSKSSKHKGTWPDSATSASSSSHPFEHARALQMQAKLQGARCSPTPVDCITLAGCNASLAQRQQSHTEASTSAPTPSEATARGSSRMAKSSKAGKGTARGSKARGKAATALDEDEQRQGKQAEEATGKEDRMRQAQTLMQAYQLSQGCPLVLR